MEQTPITLQDQQHWLDIILLRNDFLNEFSELETLICGILQSCGDAPSNQPFGRRVQSFRSAEKTPKIAKSNFSDRDKLANMIAELLPVRADIVHSRMQPCVIDGESAALFVNSQVAYTKFPTGRAIKLSQLKGIINQLISLQSQIALLGRKANPPSSPPPPSLASTTDP